MHLRRLLIIGALAFALLPATASAQGWFFTPFVGANFGGNASFGDSMTQMMRSRGASISAPRWAGTRAWLGSRSTSDGPRTSLKIPSVDSNFEFGDSNVTTVMGNLLISAPPGRGIRPYGSAGLGIIRSQVSGFGDFLDDVTGTISASTSAAA